MWRQYLGYFSPCSCIMEAEGTVTELHCAPLSAKAITWESHFVLMFHFHSPRASHFHAFKQSVMQAQTNQP